MKLLLQSFAFCMIAVPFLLMYCFVWKIIDLENERWCIKPSCRFSQCGISTLPCTCLIIYHLGLKFQTMCPFLRIHVLWHIFACLYKVMPDVTVIVPTHMCQTKGSLTFISNKLHVSSVASTYRLIYSVNGLHLWKLSNSSFNTQCYCVYVLRALVPASLFY